MINKAAKKNDGLTSKIKGLFKSSNRDASQASLGFVSKTSKEFVFTREWAERLGPDGECNLQNRLKALKDFELKCLKKAFEANALENLLLAIQDLFVDNLLSSASKRTALNFLAAVCSEQKPSSAAVREILFNLVTSGDLIDNFDVRLDVLRLLSNDGQLVSPFEERVGETVLLWLNACHQTHLTEFLQFLNLLIQYNASCFEESVVRRLVETLCLYACHTCGIGEVHSCLSTLKNIMLYSWLPGDCQLITVTSLCKLVNIEALCVEVWSLMRSLLCTHIGNAALATMCSIMESAPSYPEENVLRGCVYFVGMALWGANFVPSFNRTTWSAVLPCLYRALASDSHLVAFEVIVSLHRLIDKYGKDIHQLITWDSILQILEKLLRLTGVTVAVSANNSSIECGDDSVLNSMQIILQVSTKVHDTLNLIESLHEKCSYSGSIDHFFALIERFASNRPEQSIIRLLSYKQQGIGPNKSQWLGSLRILLECYYQKEKRSSIRIKSLNVLKNVFNDNQFIYCEQIIDVVVRPICEKIEFENDFEVQAALTNLLLDFARSYSGDQYFEMLELLKRSINYRLESNVLASAEFIDDDISFMKYLENAVQGLLELMKQKWACSTPSHCLDIFDMLVSHVSLHYKREVAVMCAVSASKVREMVLFEILSLRNDLRRHVGVKTAAEKMAYSSHIVCVLPQEPQCSENSPTSFARVVYFTNMKPAMELIVTCLQKECVWNVLRMVLTELPHFLINRCLTLCGIGHISILCSSLIALTEDSNCIMRLIGTPETFSHQDLKDHIYPCLAALVSYREYLDESLQLKLVLAIQTGLVSCKSTLCVIATIHCMYEMADILAPMIRDLLRRLSEMRSVAMFAIPVLELLNSLILFPKLCDLLTEKDFRHLFESVIPYTDPFKFTHFIVAFAYFVIQSWFLRCPLEYRPAISSCIVNAMESTSRKSLDCTTENMDRSLMLLHDEGKAVCLNFLALYCYTNVPLCGSEKSMMDFVMSNALSKSWIFGNKIITINVSIGSVASRQQMCRNCSQLLSSHSSSSSYVLTSQAWQRNQAISDGDIQELRRRHQSAIHRNVTRMPSPPRAQDDLCLDHAAQKHLLSKPVDSSLSVNFDMPTFSTQNLSSNPMSPCTDIPDFANWPPVCQCWCEGWAEVIVRQPMGTSSWMIRVPNLTGAGVFFQDVMHYFGNPSSIELHGSFADLPVYSQSVSSDKQYGIHRCASDASALLKRQPLLRNADSNVLHDDLIEPSRHFSISNTGNAVRPDQLFVSETKEPNVCACDSNGSHLISAASVTSVASSYHTTKTDTKTSSVVPDSTQFTGSNGWVVDPSSIFLQFYSGPLVADVPRRLLPVLLPNTDSVTRSLKNLDRCTGYETRKIGVVYVGPGQKTEAEILRNQYGSVKYQKFLEGLGHVISLRDVDPSMVYTGGLDTSGRDGLFTYYWCDQIMRVLFHVATLMPTRLNDPDCNQKKLHIGNDFVKIVYNDSNDNFKLDILKGDFSYVAIVVQPADHSTMLISLQAKDEISRWLALKQAVVGVDRAPLLCRQMALQADLSANSYPYAMRNSATGSSDQQSQASDLYLSNAVVRLRQIRRLQEAHMPTQRHNSTSFTNFT